MKNKIYHTVGRVLKCNGKTKYTTTLSEEFQNPIEKQNIPVGRALKSNRKTKYTTQSEEFQNLI